jgi:hypothetical protein
VTRPSWHEVSGSKVRELLGYSDNEAAFCERYGIPVGFGSWIVDARQLEEMRRYLNLRDMKRIAREA